MKTLYIYLICFISAGRLRPHPRHPDQHHGQQKTPPKRNHIYMASCMEDIILFNLI